MTYQTEVLADTPLAYYRLGDASTSVASDSSGNSRDGAYSGGTRVTGLVTSSTDKASQDVRVSVPDAAWQRSLTAITLEALINVSASGLHAIVGKTNAGGFGQNGAGAYRLFLNDGTLTWQVFDAGLNPMFALTAPSVGGARHHVAGVWDGTTARLYVDGTQVASQAASGVMSASDVPFQIGTMGGNFGVSGVIDEVAIYGTALSSIRVAVHAGAGAAPATPVSYAEAVTADAPLGWWRLDETSGAAAADSSGNARDGVATAGVTRGSDSLLVGGKAITVGSNNRVSVPYGAWMSPAAWTYEAWIKPTALGGIQTVIGRNGEGGYAGIVRLDGGKIRPVMGVGSYQEMVSTIDLVNGTTYHIVWTFDGTNYKLYINGALNATRNLTANVIAAASTPMTIGANGGNTAAEGFTGVIDEAAYYGSALSAARVQAHYDARTVPDGPMNVTKTVAIAGQALETFDTNPFTSTPPRVVDLSGGWAYDAASQSLQQTVQDSNGRFVSLISVPRSTTIDITAAATLQNDNYGRKHLGFFLHAVDTAAVTGYRIVNLDGNWICSVYTNGTETAVAGGTTTYAAGGWTSGETRQIRVTRDPAGVTRVYSAGVLVAGFTDTTHPLTRPGFFSYGMLSRFDNVQISSGEQDIAMPIAALGQTKQRVAALSQKVMATPTPVNRVAAQATKVLARAVPERRLSQMAVEVLLYDGIVPVNMVIENDRATPVLRGYDKVVVEDGAIEYYKLDELTGNFIDRIASRELVPGAGVFRGQPPIVETKSVGDYAARSNGTYIGNRTDIQAALLTSTQSIECWVNVPGDGNVNGMFVKYGNRNGWGVGVGANDADNPGRQLVVLHEYIAWRATGWYFPAGPGIYHIIVTRNVGETRVYVNGLLVHTTTASQPTNPAANESTTLGAATADTGAIARVMPTSWTLDNVSFYPTVLTAQQAGKHYLAGSGRQALETDAARPVNKITSKYAKMVYDDQALAYYRLGELDTTYELKRFDTIPAGTTGQTPVIVDYAGPGGTTKAIQTFDIGDSQSTFFEFPLTLSVPDTVTFNYEIQSEGNYDYGSIDVNGARIMDRSGYTGPSSVSATLAAGTHVIRVSFRKDGSVSGGYDNIRLWSIRAGAPLTTMLDSSGNNRDGVYGGAVSVGAADGLVISDPNRASVFAGGGGVVPYDTWAAPAQYTYMAWIKPSAFSGIGHVIGRNGGPGYSGIMRMNGSTVSFIVNNGGYQEMNDTAPMVVGKVYHVAVTYDGVTMCLYVNGVLKNSRPMSGAPNVAAGTPLTVGSNGTNGEYFQGTIDEAVMYGSALSLARIQQYYAGGAVNGFLGNVLETDIARKIRAVQYVALGAVPEELDEAIPIDIAGIPPQFVDIFPAEEHDDARFTTMALQVVERDIAQKIAVSLKIPVRQVEETDLATVLKWTIQAVTDNRIGGRARRGTGTAAWTPPVAEAPADLDLGMAYDVVNTFSVPTFPNHQPTYTVKSARKKRHRDRIIIGSRDVTYFRGVPTPTPNYQLMEPMMWGAATMNFPQISAVFERIGYGELSWLRPGARIVVQRVDVDTNQVVAEDYKGWLTSFKVSGSGLSVDIGGDISGRAALMNKQVPLFRGKQDIGRFAYSGVREVGGRLEPRQGPITGIRMLKFGGLSYFDYLTQVCALGQTETGVQYTLMPRSDGIYTFAPKDKTTIHATVYFDDAKMKPDLTRDLSEEPNRVYATGVNEEGLRIKFGAYPGLLQGEKAPYPYTNKAQNFGPGTTDGATNTGDGVTVMMYKLVVSGYLDFGNDTYPGGYDNDVVRAIKNLQKDAGLPQTGVMNWKTWKALYDIGVTGYSLNWSKILPAAERDYTKNWLRSSSGAHIKQNPVYDPLALKVDRDINVGTGFSREQIRGFAQQEMGTENNWVGTVTAATSFVRGTHNPGANVAPGDIMVPREIKPGMNIWAPLFDGGRVFHVSGVSVSDLGRSVSLMLDTRFRDTTPVWQIITRNRESRSSPARLWIEEHRSSTVAKDAITTYDEIGGKVDTQIKIPKEVWTVFPVLAGQEGTIAKFRLELPNNPEYVVAMFGQRVYGPMLRKKIGNPLTKAGNKKWTNAAVRDQLDKEKILLYVAGDDEQPCGYWPDDKVDLIDNAANPSSVVPNGRWQDDAGIPYRTFKHPVIWVAIFSSKATKVPPGRIMWPQMEEGT